MAAAVYLHNALHGQDPSLVSGNSSAPHTRRGSLSGTTLHATASEHSHPTEPLLHASTSESIAYRDMLERQPAHPSSIQPRWKKELVLDGGMETPRQRKYRENVARRRLRRLKLAKTFMEVVLAVWAAYNAIRYFLGFLNYSVVDGRTASLILGINSAIVSLLIVCGWAVSMLRPYVSRSARSCLLFSEAGIHSFAAFLLLSPAIASLVMLFVWKNTMVLGLNINQRCHVDIDSIWSTPVSGCESSPWSVWLTLSLIRLILTLAIVIVYQLVNENYYRIKRSQPTRSNRNLHKRENLDVYDTALPPYMTRSSTSSMIIPSQTQSPRPKSSTSTLQSTVQSKTSSLLHASVYGDDDFAESLYEAHGLTLTRSANASQDQFHAAYAQISQETDEAIALATAQDGSPIRENFGVPISRPHVVGYDEFGRPYPPDQTLFVMSGLVRRMPTIESVGSREFGSSIGGHRTDSGHSPVSSRQNTLMSISEYGTPGHSSLHSAHNGQMGMVREQRARTNEVGQLVDYTTSGMTGTGTSAGGTIGSTGTIETTSTDLSRALSDATVASYHTAASYRTRGGLRSPTLGATGLP